MPTTTTEMGTATTLSVSRLSDQLESARELARRERWLNTQIIDHLREIEARGLHLRAGFSGLFDYAVKELGFSEGSAYQRLQAMKLCTEYPEVKRDLQEGELTLTAVGYLQSAFDRHERRQRQWAREQRTDVAAGALAGTPGDSGAGEAGAGAPGGTADTAGTAVNAAEGTALSASAKRELIAHARGKSTRQVSELIAQIDPELVRPREKLRALGQERWELRAVIDAECRRGLEQLRHWLSHVNPAMEYGELVQRLVADGVAKYDPARQPKRATKRGHCAPPKAKTTDTHVGACRSRCSDNGFASIVNGWSVRAAAGRCACENGGVRGESHRPRAVWRLG